MKKHLVPCLFILVWAAGPSGVLAAEKTVKGLLLSVDPKASTFVVRVVEKGEFVNLKLTADDKTKFALDAKILENGIANEHLERFANRNAHFVTVSMEQVKDMNLARLVEVHPTTFLTGEVKGKVVAVDPAKNTLTVNVDGKDRVYNVDFETRYFLKKKEFAKGLNHEKLKNGAEVSLALIKKRRHEVVARVKLD